MTESVVIHDSSGDTYRDESGALTNFPTTGGGAVASVFGRTGTVVAVAGDYYAVIPAALTGATQAFRIAGATTSGAPVTGTFAVGDLVAARDGHLFMCITAGSPGTFVDTGGSVSFATPAIALGSSAAAGAASTAIRSDSTIAAFDTTVPSTQAFGDTAAIGTAAFAARRDHKHAMPATPVTTINKTGSTALTGAVTLTGGTNVTLTQSGQDISIAASAGGSGIPNDGWVDASADTWTYASADSPTFTFTITGDFTAILTPGTRLKLTQTTVKYFIVTAVSVSSGTTTVTIYGGTDYTLANAAISANYYSRVKGPAGFNLDPAKWTQTFSDTADRGQANPTGGTWYNIGTSTLAIPIGCWLVSYHVALDMRKSPAGNGDINATLSTANNSESDSSMTDLYITTVPTSVLINSLSAQRTLTLAAKTSYYLNGKTGSTSLTLDFRGDAVATVIRAVCAYL